jgi:hypothetical protein
MTLVKKESTLKKILVGIEEENFQPLFRATLLVTNWAW